ncbi:MAG: hypothetical protein D4R45_05825 [Planctomycetaceae bacterium]|nr:MAG: hypothetical protein D4R45_05825 [Planctomycetaceae bacterium]
MAKIANVMKIAAILVFFAALAGSATAQEGEAIPGDNDNIVLTPDTFYVDVVHGDDDNGGLTPGTAFASIQRGINKAVDGDIILVYPGLYQEEVNFRGKALVVQGVTAGTAGVPVLHNPDDFAVSFYNGEGPDSILKNFIIKSNFMAVFIADSSPTISNLTIVDNLYGIEASDDSEPDISNIIFWNNIYSDLFGCRARFSLVSDVSAGQGNIDGDPLFVDLENGDYRLRSNRGRYWPEHDVWILDRLTSPCVDGGDPNDEPLDEPMPNGNQINMGAYGGTAQASLSPYQQSSLPGRATDPNPADGAVEVRPDVILSWTPGANAVSHDVYFGRDNPGHPVSLAFMGNQEMPIFDPDPDWLDGGTTYFWRIDEVNSNGKRIGVLWKFTTSDSPPPKGRTCFVAETDVWVDGALVSISNVAARRSVGRVDGAAIKNSSMTLPYLGKVEELQEHEGTFECHDILLQSGNRIGVAECHYFLTESGDWVAVQNLKAGTKLQTPKGSIAIVSITKRPMPYVGKVYNLKVEGSDRYLVGKDAVIVRDY